MWIGACCGMWITHVGSKFRHGLLETSLTFLFLNLLRAPPNGPLRTNNAVATEIVVFFSGTQSTVAGVRLQPALLS